MSWTFRTDHIGCAVFSRVCWVSWGICSVLCFLFFSACLITFPGMGAKYCDLHVCLSVCPLPYLQKMTSQNFRKIYVRVTCGRGLVLLWQQCNTLCTSGFLHDVIISQCANTHTHTCIANYSVLLARWRRGSRRLPCFEVLYCYLLCCLIQINRWIDLSKIANFSCIKCRLFDAWSRGNVIVILGARKLLFLGYHVSLTDWWWVQRFQYMWPVFNLGISWRQIPPKFSVSPKFCRTFLSCKTLSKLCLILCHSVYLEHGNSAKI